MTQDKSRFIFTGEIKLEPDEIRADTRAVELLEREHFLQTLDEYAADAAGGSGRFVLLAGEAGVGKTSLLETFRDLHPQSRYLWGACDGSFTPRPLDPLYEIAMDVGGRLAALCAQDADRRELFTAFIAALNDSSRPTVVVIEDLHWADDATLDWLRYLCRRIANTQTLVVASYRNDELASDHPLPAVIGQIATHRATRRMSLPTLSSRAVRQLVDGTDTDPEQLYRLTGGVPFLVEEVLSAPPGEVPTTVADIVTARLTRLSPPGRQLLAAAAVIARPADPHLLATVADVDISALDECLASGGLVGGPTTYHFRHEITRMAIERSIPAHRHSRLHASALNALEAAAPTDHARLAHHAEAAGDSEQALRHARLAATAAVTMRSNREAAAQFRRALRFVDAGDAIARAELHEGLASALALVDHWTDSIVEREEALTLRRQLGDRLKISENLRGQSRCLWRLCRGDESQRAAREAYLLTVDAPPSEERAWAHAYYSASMPAGAASAEAVQLIEEALRQAEEFGFPEVSAYALNSIGMYRFQMGQDAFDDIQRSIDVGLEHGFDEQVARGYANLYQAATDRFRFAEYEQSYVDGLAYCRDNDMDTYSVCIRGSRVGALTHSGRLDEAIALAEQTLRETVSPINWLHLIIGLVPARLRKGDPSVSTLLDEGWQLAVQTQEKSWQIALACGWAEAAWLSGDPDSLDQRAIDAYECAAGEDAWLVAGLAVRLDRLGRLSRRPDELPEPYARELTGNYAAAAAWWHSAGCPFDEAALLTRIDDKAALRDALEIFSSLGMTPAAAVVRRQMRAAGHVVVPRGPRPATRADRNGLTPREAEVLALLREGLSNAAISRHMFISERTVHHHVSAVLAKLGVRSRADAAGAG